jgi:aminopeptidase
MAEVLVDYFAGVRPKETVLISGSTAAVPLMRELCKRVLRKGALPLVRVGIPEIEHDFYSIANAFQLRQASRRRGLG